VLRLPGSVPIPQLIRILRIRKPVRRCVSHVRFPVRSHRAFAPAFQHDDGSAARVRAKKPRRGTRVISPGDGTCRFSARSLGERRLRALAPVPRLVVDFVRALVRSAASCPAAGRDVVLARELTDDPEPASSRRVGMLHGAHRIPQARRGPPAAQVRWPNLLRMRRRGGAAMTALPCPRSGANPALDLFAGVRTP
jgi:hypothetical protein